GMQEHCPDLTKVHLRDAIEHSRLFELTGTSIEAHQQANPKCMACPYHRWCQGGCPAQALEFDDTNYNGVDYLRCEFFENHWTDQILRRMQEISPQTHCTNLPADFPLGKE
ncbi:MAG: SPASM domain-containing protein, partial [Oscillospiraceae bacterium]|nr:SPASM domain-containing protein [Oscillospiraceae bacterium]